MDTSPRMHLCINSILTVTIKFHYDIILLYPSMSGICNLGITQVQGKTKTKDKGLCM